jgi:ParB/RepB/Spo0J family partition protein
MVSVELQPTIEIMLSEITEGANVRDSLGDLTQLENSIRAHGVLIPIGVSRGEKGYRICFGFRRFSACVHLGMDRIPAVLVPDGTKALVANLLENFHRVDLSPIDEAEGFRQLNLQFGIEPGDVGELVGRSESHIRGRILLLDLHPTVKQAVVDAKVSVSNAEVLTRLPQEEQERWLGRAKRLSVRALREEIDFRLLPPEQRDQLGAQELARRAGADPERPLPESTIQTALADTDDPRLLLAPAYVKRMREHLEALRLLWDQLPEPLLRDCTQGLIALQVALSEMLVVARPAGPGE